MYALDINYIHEEESQAGALELVVTPVDPWAKARCRDGHGTLTHLFFSDEVLEIARAKAICAKCALREQCLADALEREEPWGVWGGELLSGGRIVFNKRPGGRPPKRPRPPVIVNELGVVESGGSDLSQFDIELDDDLEPIAV
jgi:hypothetical protein